MLFNNRVAGFRVAPSGKVIAVNVNNTGLAGRRILIVEDEVLVSMLIEDIVGDFGCVVVGPAARVDEALSLAGSEDIDAALLDLNLGGARSLPVADLLAQRGIPFVFMSGYGALELQPPHDTRPVLEKPFSPESIETVLLRALG